MICEHREVKTVGGDSHSYCGLGIESFQEGCPEPMTDCPEFKALPRRKPRVRIRPWMKEKRFRLFGWFLTIRLTLVKRG